MRWVGAPSFFPPSRELPKFIPLPLLALLPPIIHHVVRNNYGYCGRVLSLAYLVAAWAAQSLLLIRSGRGKTWFDVIGTTSRRLLCVARARKGMLGLATTKDVRDILRMHIGARSTIIILFCERQATPNSVPHQTIHILFLSFSFAAKSGRSGRTWSGCASWPRPARASRSTCPQWPSQP